MCELLCHAWLLGLPCSPGEGEDEWLGDNIFYLFIQFPLMNKNLRRGSDQRIRVSPHHTPTLTPCPPTPIPSEKQMKQIFDFYTRSFSPLIFDLGLILSFLHVCFFFACMFVFFKKWQWHQWSLITLLMHNSTFSHSPAQVQPGLESSLKWDPGWGWWR